MVAQKQGIRLIIDVHTFDKIRARACLRVCSRVVGDAFLIRLQLAGKEAAAVPESSPWGSAGNRPTQSFSLPLSSTHRSRLRFTTAVKAIGSFWMYAHVLYIHAGVYVIIHVYNILYIYSDW